MKVLIVEDNLRNIQELTQTVVSAFPAGDVVIKQSRDTALAALQNETFDLIILDRKIPTSDGAMDDDVAHGETVYGFIKAEIMGTPVRFWTAFPDDDYYNNKMADVLQEDIWGTGVRQTVGIIRKGRFDQIRETIGEVKAALDTLDMIELRHRPGKAVELNYLEKRILKVFAKRVGGTAVEAMALSGGLSDAKVLRVAVFAGANQIHLTVGKLTTIRELSEELKRYQHFVRLLPGAAPAIVCQVRTGAGRYGGTFYQLAAGHEKSLFAELTNNPKSGGKLVAEIRKKVGPWLSNAEERKITIAELRRSFVSDDIFKIVSDALPGQNLTQFESHLITLKICCCHGDLHGENVLFDDNQNPILIDFGEAGVGCAAIDPLTLELSAIFHPNGMLKTMKWPSASQAKHWVDVNLYLKDCPYPSYVNACRDWAYEVAHGNRAIYAIAYAYLVKQFKYRDTDKEIAKALIEAVVTAYAKT